MPRLRMNWWTCWTATKASRMTSYVRGMGMPRLQRRLPGGAFGSFASRFTGTAEELPGSVGAGVWVGAARGFRNHGGFAGRLSTVERGVRGHLVDAHGFQLREVTSGEDEERECRF